MHEQLNIREYNVPLTSGEVLHVRVEIPSLNFPSRTPSTLASSALAHGRAAGVMCDPCTRVNAGGLLRAVPRIDLPSVRRDRIVLICSGCSTAFVRPDGRV